MNNNQARRYRALLDKIAGYQDIARTRATLVSLYPSAQNKRALTMSVRALARLSQDLARYHERVNRGD